MQGPHFRTRHLRSGSCIVAFLCLVDDLLQLLPVIIRAVPAVPLYVSLQMLVQVQTPQKARVPACLQGSEFHSIKEADERRGCRGCRVQRRPHREGVAEQSPASSPVCRAEGGAGQAEKAPGGNARGPGLQGGRELGRPTGRRPGEPRPPQAGLPLQSSDSGNQGARAGSGHGVHCVSKGHLDARSGQQYKKGDRPEASADVRMVRQWQPGMGRSL